MITIHQGSILDAKADYIVNPANNFLNHAGGLARVIADAATDATFPPELQHAEIDVLYESHRERKDQIEQWHQDHAVAPLLATGKAYLTSAGRLPFKGVIHAVGPIWNGGDYCEADLLELVHDNTFQLADSLNAESIALPAISTGIFGFPVKEAARIAIAVAGWYSGTLDIQFWLFSDEHRAAFAAELACQHVFGVPSR